MKCIKCKCKNITKANYCKNCGYHFSKEEQEAAKKRTLVGKVERLEKIYKTCTLQIITGNIIFKIASLLIVLFVGIYFLFHYGNKVTILENTNYQIEYNTELDEYYLLVKDDETNLDLFVPNKIDSLDVKLLDENNQELEGKKYNKNSEIKLKTTGTSNYYLLNTISNNQVDDTLKILVYRIEEES